MDDSTPETFEKQVLPSQIPYHYIKSNYYRVVHADGAFGGVTTRGLIHMDLFSERNPIPQMMTLQVQPDGRLGEEIAGGTVKREGVVREMEVGATMDLSTAKAILTWLQDKIDVLERLQQSTPETP